jgi:hypothetical protein
LRHDHGFGNVEVIGDLDEWSASMKGEQEKKVKLRLLEERDAFQQLVD